ncbi:hypothetical protein MKW94_016145 [Papaver nudicaule]|uniref:Uncharacterized protein n=1 Tax=Papaver nudicaule TaxID=74823 RepID=A0AA41RX20_PAPNU|nr:hypothetical protein [Papaver nudicaule]
MVLELIYILNRWESLGVNDLIATEARGKQIFGFVESKGWFGFTIKMNKGERVFISNGKVNGVIIKFGNQIKEGKHCNWRFTTDLKININQVHRVEKEIYKIFKEDKDLEQEDAFVLLSGVDWANKTAVFLVSWITKTGTHEEYFTIRDALLLKLQKLIDTNS